MKTFADPVRAEIRALRGYALTPEAVTPLRAKLDFNESPYDVPADVKERVLSRLAARRWSLYPEFGALRLKDAIARSIGRPPGEIVAGNGSGELLLAAVSVFAGSGGALLLPPPTFSLYGQLAAIAGARVVDVPRRGGDFTLDEETFISRAAEGGRTVPLVCSPNNPTGGVVSLDFVRRLCEIAPVVLLDQAYVDFAGPGDDALSLLDDCPGLVVFRTLSKAFSAAGFRIGYAVARPALALELAKAVLPFSVDQAAEELAVALLEAPEIFRRTVRTIAGERDRVAAGLRALGCSVAPSRSNFLFFAPPGDARGLRATLLSRGVLIRDMTSLVPNRLRVTIGTPEENDLFLVGVKESR